MTASDTAKQMMKYYATHEVCPECGDWDFTTTYVAYLAPPDENQVRCACGWEGIVDELIPRRSKMTRNNAVRLMAKTETAKNYAKFDPQKTCGSGFTMTAGELADNKVVTEVMSIAAQQVRANVPIKYRSQIRTSVRDAGSTYPEGSSVLYWQ
jgi:hypothetical protein